MKLINTSNFPKSGWTYREPSINWTNPDPLNGEGFDYAVRMIQQARANNPASGLDPSYEACAEALSEYTCRRLNNNPKWCTGDPEVMKAQAAAIASRGCGGCGKK